MVVVRKSSEDARFGRKRRHFAFDLKNTRNILWLRPLTTECHERILGLARENAVLGAGPSQRRVIENTIEPEAMSTTAPDDTRAQQAT
jgi:hypothetical protein